MTRLISKSAGSLALTLAPELGGAIASLTWREIDILRPLPSHGERRVNLAGSFPLLPYSNRIADGCFTYAGARIELAKNFGEHPHSIHGNSWQLPWQVSDESTDSVTLMLHHQAQGEARRHWPWPYLATQYFVLRDNTLQVTLSYHNLAARTVPVGLGFHPYFANAQGAEIQFIANGVLLNDANHLPQCETPVPEQWDYRQFRAPVAGSVDNCFTGWSGEATIRWPQQRCLARISAPGVRNAVLFMPPAEKNFVAIEPVTNINNAINDLAMDANQCAMHSAAPGGSFTMTMQIEVADYE